MGTTLQLNSHNVASLLLLPSSKSHNFNNTSLKPSKWPNHQFSFSRLQKIRVAETLRDTAKLEASQPQVEDDGDDEKEDENPGITFAFVSSVLLPDGTPDVHYRRACGGQKLRNIMLDHNVELYGPYSKPLSNCSGGGTCGTCMVEVVEGKELLSPKTDKEKEKLKRKPKNWRLACQTTVGKPDTTGMMVIQQLPEWKAHEWTYGKDPSEEEQNVDL